MLDTTPWTNTPIRFLASSALSNPRKAQTHAVHALRVANATERALLP
jgi:hypothetical protein